MELLDKLVSKKKVFLADRVNKAVSKHLFKKAKRFPKGHLLLAGSLMSVTAIALLLPSSEVEATRTQITLIEPKLPHLKTVTPEAPAVELKEKEEITAAPKSVSVTEDETLDTAISSEISNEPVKNISNLPVDSQQLAQPVLNEPEPETPKVAWIEYKVQSGDNLTKLFKRAGLGPRDVYEVSQADVKSHHFSKLRPGQRVALIAEDGVLQKLKIVKSRLKSVEFSREDDGFTVAEQSVKPTIRTRFVSGEIDSSLFLGAQSAGLSDRVTMELAQIFAWDIDFALDIRKGDQFRVLFEEKYLDGEKISEGNILAAEFTNKGDTFAAVRYEDSKGAIGYFTPDGRSMRKAFLRSPVDFRRISSNFNPERFHPVLGIKRPHRGTDYAAATGTPIRASGDGKVIWRGTKGGYGRTVILQHGGNISTLYAHMSRYQSGVTSGSRVKQGQIIGYVGKSGTATGPHLHYEFRVSGVHKNPLTVKLPDAEPIKGTELARFKSQTQVLIAELQQQAVEQVALLD